MKVILTFLLLANGLLSGCAQQDENKYKEKAQIEENAKTKADLDSLNARAKDMETDLRKRFRFYKGISYKFLGTFEINGNVYRLKMTFSPTFFVTETERVRTLEEIQEDLNNLYLSAQVVLWDEESVLGTSGCTFERVRPDLKTGKMNLISADCPLQLSLILTTPNSNSADRDSVGALLANALLSGGQDSVDHLHVEVNSKFNPNAYEVLTVRVQ